MPSHFRLSRFTTVNPARLSKGFSLRDGGLVKSPGGNMVNGEVQIMSFESMADFAALLPTLTPAQALGYGTCPHDHARIVAAAKVDLTPKGDLPTLSRTRDNFTFPAGPGLLMLDYDPEKERESRFHPRSCVRRFTACVPLWNMRHMSCGQAHPATSIIMSLANA